MKTALIFGVTGQDGYYLSELLLEKQYKVIGVKRRSSTDTLTRLHSLLSAYGDSFSVVEGDVTDPFSTQYLVMKYKPQEVYNLAAQSHVHTSFEQPAYTFNVNATGVLNILEAIRLNDLNIRFYQASTSEMFGENVSSLKDDNGLVRYFQNEDTVLAPNSPYAVAKVAAHNLVGNYRRAYGLHASCGILFNHESPFRGEAFVTQKIAKYVGKVKKQLPDLYHIQPTAQDIINRIGRLKLGNLEAKRDWGHARDYVRAMWLMLQKNEPDDYVVATGETHSVREFCELAFNKLNLDWTQFVECDRSLFRPSEVPFLRGDYSKARLALGWRPETTFKELVEEMVEAQLY